MFLSPVQDKVFESLEGEQLQPYMDAIELEGNAAQPMDEGGAEEKVRHHIPFRSFVTIECIFLVDKHNTPCHIDYACYVPRSETFTAPGGPMQNHVANGCNMHGVVFYVWYRFGASLHHDCLHN